MFVPQAGKWYFTVTCKECQSTVRFFLDESEGAIPIKARKQVRVFCDVCSEVDLYDTAEMTSTQEPNKIAARSGRN